MEYSVSNNVWTVSGMGNCKSNHRSRSANLPNSLELPDVLHFNIFPEQGVHEMVNDYQQKIQINELLRIFVPHI